MGVDLPRQRCFRCGSHKWELVYRDYRWKDALVKNVPAFRCGECGEVVLDVAVLVELERRVEAANAKGKIEFISLLNISP